MKRLFLLFWILMFWGGCYAQKTELGSVLELNKVLSDYYKNLNVYCSDSSSEHEKDVAHSVLANILTSNIVPTNLYAEMKSELGILCTDKAVYNYLSLAKDSTEHWEYQIRHFNAKYVPVDTIKVNHDVYYTAQLIVDVTRYFKIKRIPHVEVKRKYEYLFNSECNRERITFIKKDQGIWSIIKTEPLGIPNQWGVDYKYTESTLDPETEFEKFKYQYIEKFVDTTMSSSKGKVIAYGLAIVRDMSGKAGLVTMGGNEIVPPVFDSIVITEHNKVAYHNGFKYELRFRYCFDYDIKSGKTDYNKEYTDWLIEIHLKDEIESHYHEEVDCYVSDSPISWGMWVTVMGGEIPQGCSHNTPVTGMNKHDVKKFLKRIKSHKVAGIGGRETFFYFVLSPYMARLIHRNGNQLWLAEPANNFNVILRFNVYNNFTRDVNFQKQQKHGTVELYNTYWGTFLFEQL